MCDIVSWLKIIVRSVVVQDFLVDLILICNSKMIWWCEGVSGPVFNHPDDITHVWYLGYKVWMIMSELFSEPDFNNQWERLPQLMVLPGNRKLLWLLKLTLAPEKTSSPHPPWPVSPRWHTLASLQQVVGIVRILQLQPVTWEHVETLTPDVKSAAASPSQCNLTWVSSLTLRDTQLVFWSFSRWGWWLRPADSWHVR